MSRHIYGHAGARLYGPFGPGTGTATSVAQEAIDYFQRYLPGRTEAESEAELADDAAAADVADALERAWEEREEAWDAAMEKQQCPDLSGLGDDLRDALEDILCV